MSMERRALSLGVLQEGDHPGLVDAGERSQRYGEAPPHAVPGHRGAGGGSSAVACMWYLLQKEQQGRV